MKKRNIIIFIVIIVFIGALLLDTTNLKAVPVTCIVLGIAGMLFLPLMAEDF